MKNVNTIFYFLFDMNYNTNYGDKKSMRYYFIKNMIIQFIYKQSHWDNNQLGSGLESAKLRGLHEAAREATRSCANQYVFLPSDPDELVDHLKLLYFEKLGGNDSFLLNEQLIAMVDKLLEYECITTNQHQNMRSTSV